MSTATHVQRRREQKGVVRRAILDATEALLVEEGPEAFSIRKLVDRCGYTAPTIYNHFGTKTGLVDALLEERFDRLARRLRRVPEQDDPVAYLRATAKVFVDFGRRHPSHYRLLSQIRDAEDDPPRSFERSRELLESAWARLWEEGRIRAGDLDTAGQALWALCHGLIALPIQRPDYPWSPTLVEDSIDALLRGLVAPAAAERPEERPRQP
jgi:AcrR family transcriptional regulator